MEVIRTPALRPLPKIEDRNPTASSLNPISLTVKGIIRENIIITVNKIHELKGISKCMIEEETEIRNTIVKTNKTLWATSENRSFLLLSSDLKFRITLFSLCKKGSHNLGRVFFERYKNNKMIVVTVKIKNNKISSLLNISR